MTGMMPVGGFGRAHRHGSDPVELRINAYCQW